MKAHYKTADGRIVFEVNGDTPKVVFEQIAAIQDLFECETECGVCHDKEAGIRFVKRDAETHDGKKVKYYELRCRKCFARFQFGQAQEGGGLFPKRKDKDGKPLPNRGWEKYERPQRAAANGQTKPAEQANLPGARTTQPAAAPQGRRYEPEEYSGPGITDDDVPF